MLPSATLPIACVETGAVRLVFLVHAHPGTECWRSLLKVSAAHTHTHTYMAYTHISGNFSDHVVWHSILQSQQLYSGVFTARCVTVQSAVLLSHVVRPSVRLSVTLVDHDRISWKSWKLIARAISPTPSLFVAQRSFTYSQGNMEKFWGENVRSTPNLCP